MSERVSVREVLLIVHSDILCQTLRNGRAVRGKNVAYLRTLRSGVGSSWASACTPRLPQVYVLAGKSLCHSGRNGQR